jgi:hypothetical protein
MTKSQDNKIYGIEGSKKLRKQWTKARFRGKIPNQGQRNPNFKNMK